jgi:hypothetical protein
MIKWGTIFIRSSTATLKIRSISEPPKITNVAKGGEAKFTCKATGDAEATITFHKSDNQAVGNVVPTTKTDNNGVVTTTGVLTISDAKESDSFDYYCKAVWSGDAQEVKSDPVYLSVMGVSKITPEVWGVFQKSTQFKCESDASLKKNKGEFLKNKADKKINTKTTITWEYYDKASSSWKSTTEDNR